MDSPKEAQHGSQAGVPKMGEGLAIIPTCACWQQVRWQQVGLLLTRKGGAFSQSSGQWQLKCCFWEAPESHGRTEQCLRMTASVPCPALSLPSISEVWLETTFLTGTRQKLLCSSWSQGSSPNTASPWPEFRSPPHQTGAQGRGPSAPSWH